MHQIQRDTGGSSEIPKLNFEDYEILAVLAYLELQDIPEELREEAISLFHRLDDKIESLLCLKEVDSLPSAYQNR